MRSGFVSFVGRPNVGKSTLLNTIIGKKIVITSSKSNTTRHNIQGIYNDEDSQIVFVDTPGIHKPKEKMGKYLNQKAYYTIDDVDIVCLLVDASQAIGSGDKYLIDRLKKEEKPVLLIINKIDLIAKDELIKKISQYKDMMDFTEIIPVSALTKDNIKRMLNIIKHFLPDQIRYYEDDTKTNQTDAFMIGEIVREKVMRLTHDEVPYAVTTVIEKYNDKKDLLELGVVIIVDRDNLKGIILGKSGAKIKDIGIQARNDIEEYFGKKVYLELFVKVIKNWRDKEKYLEEFGLKKLD